MIAFLPASSRLTIGELNVLAPTFAGAPARTRALLPTVGELLTIFSRTAQHCEQPNRLASADLADRPLRTARELIRKV
jgi:hypothetical protein